VKKHVTVVVVIVAVFLVFSFLVAKGCSRASRSALSDTCANVLKTNGLTQDSLTCEAVCAQMAATQAQAAEHALTSDKLFQASLLNSCYREIKGVDCRCGPDKGAR
jgi:uncharacterized membrane protein (DUF2068 family)